MSIEQLTPERIGITAFVILYITKEVGVPLALKLFPQFFKRSDREQTREDKKLEFEQQMKLREIEAWENIAKYQGDIRDILGIMNERTIRIEKSLTKPERKKPSLSAVSPQKGMTR